MAVFQLLSVEIEDGGAPGKSYTLFASRVTPLIPLVYASSWVNWGSVSPRYMLKYDILLAHLITFYWLIYLYVNGSS